MASQGSPTGDGVRKIGKSEKSNKYSRKIGVKKLGKSKFQKKVGKKFEKKRQGEFGEIVRKIDKNVRRYS